VNFGIGRDGDPGSNLHRYSGTTVLPEPREFNDLKSQACQGGLGL
jgi:hypothetical protein